MLTPFPGMDPYLERPGVWHQVHADLIVDIRRFLTTRLRPRYYVAIEHLTYLAVLPPPEELVGIPDVLVSSSCGGGAVVTAVAPVAEPVVAELPQPQELKHRYLEIRDAETQEVITIIEILSPANKVGRSGRQLYEEKRLKILSSLTNLVEIDLLRKGQPMAMKVPYQADYRIVVSRMEQRPQADVYLFSVRQPIPDFPIPLRSGEEEPLLPLNKILHELYDQSGYDMMINYRKPPEPPLAESDTAWAAGVLAGEQETV